MCASSWPRSQAVHGVGSDRSLVRASCRQLCVQTTALSSTATEAGGEAVVISGR